MAAHAMRAELTLNPTAGSREKIMNVWHFANTLTSTEEAAAVAFQAALQTFYSAIDVYLSHELNGETPLLRCFDLHDPKPRQPFYTDNLTALSCGSDQAARELCLCLSYRAAYTSGFSPKRRRGRIYLGPHSSSLIDASTGRVNSSRVSAFVTAADDLLNTSNESDVFTWVVYSPTTDTDGEGDDGWYPVLEGWIDNEVDIQRRRGMPGGTRSVYTIDA